MYIVYFTTYVRNGELYFGNDLYDRDAKLVNAVGNAAEGDSASAKAVETLRNAHG